VVLWPLRAKIERSVRAERSTHCSITPFQISTPRFTQLKMFVRWISRIGKMLQLLFSATHWGNRYFSCCPYQMGCAWQKGPWAKGFVKWNWLPITNLFEVTADLRYGLRGRRRTYLTILKRAWSANFKMVWYVLLWLLRPELDLSKGCGHFK
jgi:hypothetical protein